MKVIIKSLVVVILFCCYQSVPATGQDDEIPRDPSNASEQEMIEKLEMFSLHGSPINHEIYKYFRNLSTDCLPFLKSTLNEEDTDNRQKAIKILGVLLRPKALQDKDYSSLEERLVSIFIEHLYDRDIEIRKAVVIYLGSIISGKLPDESDQSIIDILVKLLSDEEPEIRQIASEYLIYSGNGELVPERLKNNNLYTP